MQKTGILIKSAEAIEILHNVDTAVLDKTGTITEGKPKVTDIISKIEEKELLRIAGSLEKNSEHPLAEAVMQKIKEEQIEVTEVTQFKAISGRGVAGIIDGVKYFGGNISFMKENGIDTAEIANETKRFSKQGKTVLYFAYANNIIGIIAAQDTIKSTSYQGVQELKRRKLDVVMITGDNKTVAEKIGKDIGIGKIISEVMPQDKEKEVSKLQAKGKKVAFVGDGINDSPALVRADVGIAIGSGTDIAIESADIVLMKNNLLDVARGICLSKAIIKNIKMNLFWAFFYNAIGIPIAAGVFYLSLGIKLNPMIGALAMSLSSVCVVTNALRLRKFKPNFIIKDNVINNTERMNKNMKTVCIEGMQCNHCKMSVEKAVNSIDGVIKVEVDLENKNAKIESEVQIDNNVIKKVIEEAGFEVKEIKD